jgi:ribosomal protein L22
MNRYGPIYIVTNTAHQLQCSFLSQKAAAEFLGVLTTSVANAVKQKGRVRNMYTLEKVV